MFLAYIAVFAIVAVLSLVLRLASALRLTIPVLYALIAPTLFHSWYVSHTALASGIGWVLLALVMLSWAYSAVGRIRELVQTHRDECAAMDMFVRRVELAEAHGESSISTAGLFRDCATDLQTGR